MRKVAYSLVLLALIGLGLLPASANAAGMINVYFDPYGTQRGAFSPGIGQLSTLFIYGENFGADFVTGVQYAIDYGPDLTFIADITLPPVSIGTSATGISIGFGATPRPGERFLIHLALVTWATDCSASLNNRITVGPHPLFPNPTPIATSFPTQDVVTADITTSTTCEAVEIDIHPGKCPNHFKADSWKYLVIGEPTKGGKTKVAILASSTVDVNEIDPASVRLEGVAPIAWSLVDVGLPDGDNDCECDDVAPPPTGGKDGGSGKTGSTGDPDLVLEFRNPAIAAAIGPHPPVEGTEVVLGLTGAYNSGMTFSSVGCVEIRGKLKGKGHPDDQGSGKSGGGFATAGLGYPSPNPFNPVTRISYNVPSTQHVHIAIYDVAGRLVENLVNEVKAGGEYVVEWDAGRLPSGVYFYRMQTGEKTIVRRATLLK